MAKSNKPRSKNRKLKARKTSADWAKISGSHPDFYFPQHMELAPETSQGPMRSTMSLASLAAAPAAAAAPAGAPISPPTSCGDWIQRFFRPRVWMAIAVWSGVAVEHLTAATQLGQISPSPWSAGQQLKLVQLSNAGHVFAPFESMMAAPPILAPPTTTIVQWERGVWSLQTPRTPCWGPYPV
jgi:hypothetical protein